jgi:hypothetical protein
MIRGEYLEFMKQALYWAKASKILLSSKLWKAQTLSPNIEIDSRVKDKKNKKTLLKFIHKKKAIPFKSF